MKNRSTHFTQLGLITFIFLSIWRLPIFAQKLPKVQTESLKAPATVKVDGQITEWGNVFKAYNPDNRIWYTLANDDKNLYLVGKFNTDNYTFIKALNGGLSFRVYPQSILKGIEGEYSKSVTYPALKDRKEIVYDYPVDASKFRNKSLAIKTKALDSISKVANQAIIVNFKNIEITRDLGEDESFISVYNTEGVRVTGRYNSQMEYVVEMAIPLKFLNLQPGQSFTYGIALIGTYDRMWQSSKNKSFKNKSVDLSGLPVDARFQARTSEFRGQYTLVK